MKTYSQELIFNTKHRQEFINITARVEEALAKSVIKEGLCLVNPMHIIASIFAHEVSSIQKVF